jgi:ABC-type bacteriocin/lantibiotic exporter with double-glycine peptidase domain
MIAFRISIFYILLISFSIHSCTTADEIPQSSKVRLIENVPFFPQDDYQCGPSSLAGVLNYWGINVSTDEIAREIFSESARGTLNIDMLLYAQRKGLNAIQYDGDVEDLKRNIDSNYPVIVLVDFGISFHRINHFMVVVGYNENGLIINSGKKKEKFIYKKDFVKAWGKTNYWTLLIKPK